MARPRTARRGFVRPPKKTVIWIGAGVGLTTLAGSTKQLVSSLSAGALLLRPFTIMRTRMILCFSSDQDIATETPHGAFGRIVVTDTAAGIGVTAVPDPSPVTGDPDADWFVHQPLCDKVNSQNAGFFGVAAFVQFVVDSKAMRKVGERDDIVSMTKMDTAQGALLVSSGRMLIQLH